jgi:hypothetical protein
MHRQRVMLTLVGLGFALLALLAEASAPAWVDDPPEPVEGEPLAITWADESHRPAWLAWGDAATPGDEALTALEAGEKTIELPRAGLGRLPRVLVAVPADPSLRPQQVEVEEDAAALELRFAPVGANAVCFWGVTPRDPCPISMGGRLGVGARLIGQFSVHTSLHGLDYWCLERESAHDPERSMYFTPPYRGVLRSVSAKGFAPAPVILQAMCAAHHGGECAHTLTTTPDSWGRAHELVFELDEGFDAVAWCPI